MSKNQAWCEPLAAALEATGLPYFAVVLTEGGTRAVTFATLKPAQVPDVLRGIAASLQKGELVIEPPGGGNEA